LEERGFEVFAGGVGDEAWTLGALLDGGADGGEDAFSSEEVDTTVYQVGDVRFGLLDVMEDPAGMGVRHDTTKVTSSIFADTGTKDDGFGITLLEKLQHVVQREGTADIGIEDEEAFRAAFENGIAEVVEAACGAEGLVFAQVDDFDLGEFFGGVFDEVAEDGLVVVADHADFLDVGYFRDGGEAVPDDGVACDIEKRLFRVLLAGRW
jgi:hypothetical protein